MLRQRYALLPILVIAALVVTSGQVTESAAVTLQGEVDAHWRGAYDILVRPSGTRLALEQTQGVVEPNFLGFAGDGGIDASTLAALRALPDVELAAPVAVVGYVRYGFTAPSVFTSVLPAEPTVFRLTATAVTNDGITDRLIQRRVSRLLLGPADLSQGDVPFASDEQALSWGTDGLSIALPELPGIISPIIAVDPESEKILLGANGAFLEPLIGIPGRSSLRVEDFDVSLMPDEFDSERFFVGMMSGNSDGSETRPVVPVVVSDQLFATMKIKLTVEQLGRSLDKYPPPGPGIARLDEAVLEAGPGATSIGETVLDATRSLRPFGTPSLTLLWPGSEPPDGTEIASRVDTQFDSRLAGRPAYIALENQGVLSFRIKPTGPVGPTGDDPSDGQVEGKTERGVEQGYRVLVPQPLAIGVDFVPANPFDRPFVLAPVGQFTLDTLDLPKDLLNYVPLGAYNPPDSELVAGPDGAARVPPQAVRPTLNAAGFVSVPPLAVTDLAGAELLRGTASIDAVRVRVSGLAGFDGVGRARVERVASSIAELGLDVDVVAGSSPQTVTIDVPSYYPEAADEGSLGGVRQSWTTLGAAELVTRSLGVANLALLTLAALSGLLLAIAAELLIAAIRTREASVLAAIGWSRTEIVRWFGAEAALLAALVLGAALIGSGFGARPVGLAIGTVLALLAAGVRATGAVFLASSHSASRTDGDVAAPIWAASLGSVRGVAALAVRESIGRIVRTSTTIASLSVAGAAAAIGLNVIVASVAAAGPTRLSGALAGNLRPYQIALLILIAVGGLACTALLARLDLAERRPALSTLVALGWTPADIRRLLILQFAGICAAAGVLAVALASVLTVPIAALDARPAIGFVLGLCLLWMITGLIIADRVAVGTSKLPRPAVS